jgi:putative IMPACT (imprinted ancient) family translation regulator
MRILFIGVACVALVGCLLWAVWSCANGGNQSLVHLYLPEYYELLDDGEPSGNAGSMYLREGVHTLQMTRNGKDYATVIRVSGGGEIYYALEEKDIHEVVEVKYVPGP